MNASGSSRRGTLLTVFLALSFVGCRGCLDNGGDPEWTACESAMPYAAVDRHWGAMPEGDLGSTAQAQAVDPSQNSTIAIPMLDFSYTVPFTGGPLAAVRIAIGDTCYFEVPIDRARAQDEWSGGYEEADTLHDEAIQRAQAASEPMGSIHINGELSSWLSLPDAVQVEYAYQVRGDDGRWSPTTRGGQLVLCTEDDDCTPGGDDTGGGGGGGGADGGETGSGTLWKDTWLFVQSDKPVQMRMGLVRIDGTRYHVKLQYRVNSSDSIYCASCNGYHVYGVINDYKYRVDFPSTFKLGQIYEMSQVHVLDLTGENTWDSTQMRPVHQGRVNQFLPYSCVDDNSASSRCSGWESTHRFTATNNASP